MYYFEKVVAAATAEAGMRGVCGQTVLQFPSPDSDSWEAALEYTESFIQEYKDHPLIVPAVAPHAPYTCTDEILERCADLARQYDIPLHIHISETRYEVERSVAEYDKLVMYRANDTTVLDTKCICAHCVHIDSDEIKLAARKNVGISHNPSSNMKLASGLAPVIEMLQQGVKVGIGTDGAASNNDLDMMTELHLASLMAKVQTGDPTALPARDALLMATRLGAAALHLDDITGSLEVGKRADLIVLQDETLHMTPRFSHDINAVYGRVVYSAKSTDVQHVMVNGQWLMRNRDLLTLDETKIRESAQAKASEIDTFIRELAEDNFNKLVAIGGVERRESYELQFKARVKDRSALDVLLNHPDTVVQRTRYYHQYDKYFVFDNEKGEQIRYREDHFKSAPHGKTESVRARLTYTTKSKEDYGYALILSRARFIAPATYPLRFYQEYFKADREIDVEKRRYRWRITFKGVEFFVNFDEIDKPSGTFVEIKSTTWSQSDAEAKSELLRHMTVEVLQIAEVDVIAQEYIAFLK